MWRGLVSTAALACNLAFAAVASATVYTWLDDDGTRHFTNSAHEVPEPHRATARAFPTAPREKAPGDAPPAPASTAVVAPAPAPSAGATARAAADEHELTALEAAFGRGVERGAALSLAQTRAVGELAESLVDAALRRPPAPPAPPQPRVAAPPARKEPGFYVSIVPGGYRWPGFVGYGSVGPVAGCPGCCCATGLGYGFGFGRLVPHSHFFPSLAGARRAPLFFPDGHQLDANLFLVGRGYWVN